MLFNDRLLKARKQRSISQEELANWLGVHAPIIGNYERGEVKPSIQVATNIAQALGVSLDYLTGISDRELDSNVMELMDQLQELEGDDRDHILRTLSPLVREARTRATFG